MQQLLEALTSCLLSDRPVKSRIRNAWRNGLLFVFLLLPAILHAESFRQISLFDGLTQPSVMAIHQDQLGRLWFGTLEGINRYDGQEITPFKGWYRPTENDSAIWLGNAVSDIAEDRSGNLFFLIDQDLIRFDLHTERFERWSEDNQIPVLAAHHGDIWFLRHDSLWTCSSDHREATFQFRPQFQGKPTSLCVLSDQLVIGTQQGVYFIDRATRQSTHWLADKEIYHVFQSSTGEFWICTLLEGLYRMKPGQAPVEVPYLPGSPQGISSRQVRTFVEDDQHNLWFGTFNGLQKYDPQTATYSLIQVPSYAGGLAHPSIFSLCKDRQGIIWVGSYYGGVNYFKPDKEGWMHFDYDIHAPKSLYYSYISDLVTDHENRLWISTDGGGILCTDSHWNILHQFTAGPGNALPYNNIKSIDYDTLHHSLYIGTYLGGLSRYDLATGRFTNYLHTPQVPSAERPNEVIFHVQMWKGDLYLSARNGVFRLDTRTQVFHRLPIPHGYYESFDITDDGILYLGDGPQLLRVDLKQPEQAQSLPLPKLNPAARITHVLADAQDVYVTTLGSGVYQWEQATQTLHHFTAEQEQLMSNFCYNLCTSRSGHLFIISDQGITRLHTQRKTFTHLPRQNYFPGAHLIQGCGMYGSDNGKIFIGNTKGVIVLSEEELEKQILPTASLQPYLSQLWVNHKPVVPGDATGILKQALPFTRELELNYRQNHLLFDFALSSYDQHPSSMRFRYQLEGFDREWIATHQTEVHYTNLEPGTYTFRVATWNDGPLNQEPTGDIATLKIHIASPWYNTGWAWLLYLITFFGGLYAFLANRWTQRTLALSLEKERFEKQQIEKLNQAKLIFFTNVSHEFRTPLTLIISHIDLLLQRNTLVPTVYNPLLKIKKNAQKMNSLISELLEFRKLEEQQETLQLQQQDITRFLREIYLSFSDYAHQRHIRYTFDFPETPLQAWFDARLLEEVFFNLLSNAFKYTPDQGSIHLHGQVTETDIQVRITDSGIGIAESDTEKIFERFYQSDRKTSFFSSSGIGLALTKSIVEKHHGYLEVESSLGHGSTFTVTLPRKKETFADDVHIQLMDPSTPENIVPGSLPVPTPEQAKTAPFLPPTDATPSSPGYTMLLVEDNEELLQVLVELFSPFYRILTATNGRQGLQQVQEHKPDLVISDVLMPEMSGTEMCLQIKNHLDLCHIPVILLTALNSPEQNLDGLNRGADDYITKPFHAQLLLARANNLLRSRLLIQQQFNKKPITEIDLTSINPLDKDLLKRVSQVIEAQLDNPNFDIPTLCKEIGIGRTLLFTKFKALTGMTPNHYILNFRLKAAALLLQQYPDLPIAEVSDRCGFSTPAYFSRCFKHQYGCSPLSYQKGKPDPAPQEEASE